MRQLVLPRGGALTGNAAILAALQPPADHHRISRSQVVGTALHRRPVGRGVPPSRQVGSRVPRDRFCRRPSAPCAQTIPANRIASRQITTYETPSEGPRSNESRSNGPSDSYQGRDMLRREARIYQREDLGRSLSEQLGLRRSGASVQSSFRLHLLAYLHVRLLQLGRIVLHVDVGHAATSEEVAFQQFNELGLHVVGQTPV